MEPNAFPPRLPGRTQFWRIALTDKERAVLGKFLAKMPNPYQDFEDALAHARQGAFLLPVRILRAVAAWQHCPGAPGMLVVMNLPEDPTLPPTPTDGRAARGKATFESEGRLLLFGLLVGEIFGYLAERLGDLIHNTVPIPGSELSPSSSGSAILLEAHTEVTACRFQRVAPEYLALTFPRGDFEAATLYADALAIYERLSSEDWQVGRMPIFRTQIPESFTNGLGGGYEDRVLSHPHPIFQGPEGDPEIIFDASATESDQPEGQRLVTKITAMLADPSLFKPAVGMPGNLFFLNNRRGIHGRTPFHPDFNGAQRWPQRVYITSPGAIHDNREHFDFTRRIFTSIPVPA